MRWSWPATVEITLIVNRIAFTAAGTNSDSVPILDNVEVQALSINTFQSVKLVPEELELANPAQYDFATGRYPNSAWRRLELDAPQLIIAAGDRRLNPRVTVVSDRGESDNLIKLYPLQVKSGSDVILHLPGDQQLKPVPNGDSKNKQYTELVIRVSSKEPRQDVLVNGVFQLNTEHCQISGIRDTPLHGQSLSYKASLRESHPAIEIAGRDNVLGFAVMVPPEQSQNLFAKTGMVMIGPEFIRESSQTQSTETSLVQGTEGIVTYLDYPKKDKVLFKFPETIWLDKQNKFIVKDIQLKPENGGVSLRLEGTLRQLATGLPGLEKKEHYLTAFTVLQQNPVILTLLGIIGWVAPTALSIRKFIKELYAELKPPNEPKKDEATVPAKKKKKK